MHCWKCEETIETTGGMYEIINYDLSKAVYSFKKMMIIECPHCELMIGITNYEIRDLKQKVKIDPTIRTKIPL